MDYIQTIKEQIATLPETIKSFINTDGWRKNVEKIGKQLNIKEKQLALLENEVLLVLICLEPPSDFVENIKREVGLDESTARSISNYINGTVFGVVMKDIKLAWSPASRSMNYDSGIIDKKEIKNTEEEWSKPNLANMAKAMGVNMPPENLPSGDSPKLIHNYTKTDPYRETPE